MFYFLDTVCEYEWNTESYIFHCTNAGPAIPCSQVCDSTPQCPSNQDEAGCLTPTTCPEGVGRCLQCGGSMNLISEQLLCDGVVDCEGDEVGCLPCAGDSSQLVHVQLLCDGKQHCDSGADESNCT